MAAGDRSRITLRLPVPYATPWGQTVKVVGPAAALGEGDTENAPALTCRPHGDLILWGGDVSAPRAATYSYKYVVVGEEGQVEEVEVSDRSLHLPSGLEPGAGVDVHDEWQVHPAHALWWSLTPSAPPRTAMSVLLHASGHLYVHHVYGGKLLWSLGP